VLLVFGGESGGKATNQMLSYDPEFEVWYEAVDRGHRPSARLGHTATLHAANGRGAKLLVWGGVLGGGRRFAEPELHELHIGADWAWKRVLAGGAPTPPRAAARPAFPRPHSRPCAGKPPFGRAYHSATRLSGGRVLVFGGNDGDKSFRKP